MAYYTFCDRAGSKVFHRWVDDEGNRRQEVVSEFPISLFMKSKADMATHKSIYGDTLVEKKFDSVSDASTFIKQYKDIMPIFGQTSFAHQFISNQYPGEIQLDMSRYVALNFDIETRFDGYDPDDRCMVRRTSSNLTEEVDVGHMRTLGSGWEVYDIYNDTWYRCDADHPLCRPGGFPEPQKADYEITSIACKVFGKPKKITLGLKDYKVRNKDEVYIRCQDEAHLLREFITLNQVIAPDAWVGWNIEAFDIPYIINRIEKVLGEGSANKLSPFHGNTSKGISEYFDKESGDRLYRVLGIATMDYLQLYKQFNPTKKESYTLDFIGQDEVGEKKVDYSEYDGLMGLYRDNFQKYIEYNIQDIELVERIDQKKQFLRLAVTTVLLTKSRYQEISGKVKLWDNLIYNMLREDDVVIPPLEIHRGQGIIGAYVKEPIPAKYRWVGSLDLTSLYPSICMMFNMSPETLVRPEQGQLDWVARLLKGEDLAKEAREKGLCMAANGTMFRTDFQGVLPRGMKYVFDTRKAYKTQMLAVKAQKEEYVKGGGKSQVALDEFDDKIASLEASQGAMKVLANSGYGCQAQPSFRYYSLDIAQGITLTGQLAIQYIANMTNKFMNARFDANKDWVITMDTDSMYVQMDTIPTDPTNTQQSVDEIDRFIEKELQPFIDMAYQKLSDKLGCPRNLLDMKREAISDVGIFRGKKNYVLQVWDMEGVRYNEPYLKAMGIETARSDKPQVVRDALSRCLQIFLNGTEGELIDEIGSFQTHWDTLDYDTISKPMGVSSMEGKNINTEKAYHVKAALHHNKLLVDLGLERKYNRIKSGAKIRILPLKTPNPIHNKYIAYQGHLPSEFGLDEYVDRKGQLETLYMQPVKSFTDILGWQTERVSSLEELFG